MKFRNEEARQLWQSWIDANTEGYGLAAITFTQRWAEGMEERLMSGSPLSEIADEESDKADTEGITGFQYGLAVQALSQTWLYGEELRIIHNKAYGVSSDEAGVVNPAILIRR